MAFDEWIESEKVLHRQAFPPVKACPGCSLEIATAMVACLDCYGNLTAEQQSQLSRMAFLDRDGAEKTAVSWIEKAVNNA